MSEMELNVSGMLVNKDGEVVSWVNKGDTVDLKDGDQIVSHHKTAEKMGLLDKFNELKAANKPVKAAKSEGGEGGEKKARVSRTIPESGKYEVLKPDFAAAQGEDDRAECYKFIGSHDEIADFYAAFPDGYKFTGSRDGKEKTCTAKNCVSYSIDRGFIRFL